MTESPIMTENISLAKCTNVNNVVISALTSKNCSKIQN